jgi:hypothetical protein
MAWEVVPIRRNNADLGLTLSVSADSSIRVRKEMRNRLGSQFKILHDPSTGLYALKPATGPGPNVKPISHKQPRFSCEQLVDAMKLEPGDEIRTKLDGNVYLLLRTTESGKKQ